MMKTKVATISMALFGLSTACVITGTPGGDGTDDGGTDDGGTEDAGSDDAGTGGDSSSAEGTTGEPTTQGSGESGGSEEGSSAEDGNSDDGSSDDGSSDDGGSSDGGCPEVAAPAVPDCANCVLTEECNWECDFAACTTCPVDGCGVECVVCDDPDDCLGGFAEGECNYDGTCIVDPDPLMCGSMLDNGFEEDLTAQGGCADLHMYAHAPDDTVMLVMTIGDLDVNAITEPTTFSDLGVDDFTTLEVRVGSAVSQAECNDAIVPPGPQVDDIWTAVDASVDITITPGPGGPTADAVLSDVTLSNGGFALAQFDSYTFSDVAVGWLPG